MVENYTSEGSEITFAKLCLEQVSVIQKLCSDELRSKYTLVPPTDNKAQVKLYLEDSRLSFVQSVEILGSMLSPYINKGKKENQEQLKKFSQIINLSLSKYYNMFKSDMEEEHKAQKELKINEVEDLSPSFVKTYRMEHKILSSKEMFTMLIQVLNDNNFLKSPEYLEGQEAEA